MWLGWVPKYSAIKDYRVLKCDGILLLIPHLACVNIAEEMLEGGK